MANFMKTVAEPHIYLKPYRIGTRQVSVFKIPVLDMNRFSHGERVLVDSKTNPLCDCDVTKMFPRYAVNTKGRLVRRVCGTCGKRATEAMNDAYNQHYGFSGWDDGEEY